MTNRHGALTAEYPVLPARELTRHDYESLLALVIASAAVAQLLVGEIASGAGASTIGLGGSGFFVVSTLVWAAVALPLAILARLALEQAWAPNKRGSRLATAVVVSTIAHAMIIAVLSGLAPWLHPTSFDPTSAYLTFRGMLRNDAVVAVLLTMTVYAYEHGRAGRMTQARERELRAETTRAQLEVLRMQLNPHFLFNSLNAISALIDDEPKAAQRMVDQLGAFLRQTLLHAPLAEVALSTEVGLLQDYLAIEGVRFGHRLQVVMRIAPDASHAMIPVLLLQPLVENAVRHGIQPSIAGGAVSVHADVFDGQLRIRVIDDGVGLGGTSAAAANGTGLGLRNTRERLRHVHGRRASLDVRGGEPRGTVVTISMPLRPSPAPPPART